MSDKNCCEIYKSSLLHRLLIYWESRDLGVKVDRLITLLCVSIFFDKAIYPEELDVAKEVLANEIKDKNKTELLFEKIKLRLSEYIKNYDIYLHDRDLAFAYIREDVQLYRIMKDVFEAEGVISDEEMLAESVVKKEYDKNYKLEESEVFHTKERRWK